MPSDRNKRPVKSDDPLLWPQTCESTGSLDRITSSNSLVFSNGTPDSILLTKCIFLLLQIGPVQFPSTFGLGEEPYRNHLHQSLLSSNDLIKVLLRRDICCFFKAKEVTRCLSVTNRRKTDAPLMVMVRRWDSTTWKATCSSSAQASMTISPPVYLSRTAPLEMEANHERVSDVWTPCPVSLESSRYQTSGSSDKDSDPLFHLYLLVARALDPSFLTNSLRLIYYYNRSVFKGWMTSFVRQSWRSNTTSSKPSAWPLVILLGAYHKGDIFIPIIFFAGTVLISEKGHQRPSRPALNTCFFKKFTTVHFLSKIFRQPFSYFPSKSHHLRQSRSPSLVTASTNSPISSLDKSVRLIVLNHLSCVCP